MENTIFNIISQIIIELSKKNYDISFAESCTGGMLSSFFVEMPGISKYFFEGLVTYSNESKIARLGVKKETIQKFGAVSEETVKEMLKGLKTKIGIAISGIAGPSGGTKEKPVGTVFIGIKILDNIHINRYIFEGNRQNIRYKSCVEATKLLLEILRKET